MRFSIWPSPAQPWDDILEIAVHCEQTGWDGVYFADHFMPNGPGPAPLDGDTLECWSVIAGLAALVPRIRLAPLVTSVTYRHPAVLAKIAAAVDQISHGRLTLGVRAGWQENEHLAARYAEAGADEFIVPDSTLGSLSRKKDACDLFIEQVAPAFR
jgi:alkanesulfonate monooxygenase SsuD/methylene tetrahydromethanopterin reductase-like flavin-dependent oxidoreductase (luciferase family)